MTGIPIISLQLFPYKHKIKKDAMYIIIQHNIEPPCSLKIKNENIINMGLANISIGFNLKKFIVTTIVIFGLISFIGCEDEQQADAIEDIHAVSIVNQDADDENIINTAIYLCNKAHVEAGNATCQITVELFQDLCYTHEIASRYISLFDQIPLNCSHATAEIWIGTRWIAVDPTFNMMFKIDNAYVSYSTLSDNCSNNIELVPTGEILYEREISGDPLTYKLFDEDGNIFWDPYFCDMFNYSCVDPGTPNPNVWPRECNCL